MPAIKWFPRRLYVHNPPEGAIIYSIVEHRERLEAEIMPGGEDVGAKRYEHTLVIDLWFTQVLIHWIKETKEFKVWNQARSN